MKSARRDEAGFTLIELMIALTISAVIAAALGVAISVGISDSKTTTQRLALSHDAEASARWFAQDAGSATQDGVSTAGSTCVSGAGSTPVVTFSWNESTAASDSLGANSTAYVANWVLQGGNLVRYQCIGASPTPAGLTMSRNVKTIGAVQCSPTASCATPVKDVSLQVTESDNVLSAAANFIYTLGGHLRTGSSTFTPPPPSSFVPLLTLDTGSNGILVSGSGSSLSVMAGQTAVVDSAAPDAIHLTGSGSMISGSYDTLAGGGCTRTGGGPASCGIVTGVSPGVADPYANVPGPTCSSSGTVTPGPGASPDTYSPGNWPSGLSISGSSPAVLLPGIYCIDSAGGFTKTGSGSLTGTGVLLYLKNPVGDLSVAGSGTITLSPYANPGSLYDGLLVEHVPTYNNNDSITGSSSSAISGGFYGGGGGDVTLGGTATYAGIQVIAGSLTVNGGATATIGRP
jgi:prepilin-type N-terminal cleavage/methylation domain-containing protein